MVVALSQCSVYLCRSALFHFHPTNFSYILHLKSKQRHLFRFSLTNSRAIYYNSPAPNPCSTVFHVQITNVAYEAAENKLNANCKQDSPARC